MLPVLFEIFGIPIYSFGLMMGIAFLVANYLFAKEMTRRGMPEAMAGTITLIALIGGVAGAKLFSLIENWDAFMADPAGQIFSAAGLTFYGGLIVATLAIYIYVRGKKLRFLPIADASAPALIIAYGIGRIGCQLSGDGDYGVPSELPWAMGYANGTVSTLAEKNIELADKFREMYPGRPVPVDIEVHPAPVYETLAAIAIFILLWSIRKRPMAAGKLFSIYLICAGIERLLVEFIRLNPLILGLSEAQWISIGMILLGSIMLYTLRGAPPEVAAPTKVPRRARTTPARAAR
jgi:phosphatidylglycerol---prolipoprotein diacylglyceryl transferase